MQSPLDIAWKGPTLVNDLAKIVAELENENIVSITARIRMCLSAALFLEKNDDGPTFRKNRPTTERVFA